MTDEQFSSRFKAISDWCSRNNEFAAGWPNFLPVNFPDPPPSQDPVPKMYEHFLIRDEYVVWRDVKETAGSGNDAYEFTDIRTRFSAAHDYAQANGFDHGFPNFYQADYGNGIVYGMFLIRGIEHVIQDIPVSELFRDRPGFATTDATTDPERIPMEEWFRAASDYLFNHRHPVSYIAAMPTGHYNNRIPDPNVKVIFFKGENSSSPDPCSDKSEKIEFKKIRGKELNLPDVAQTTAVEAVLKKFLQPNRDPYPSESDERKFADEAVRLITKIVNDKEFIERVKQGKYSRAKFETEDFGKFKDPIPNEEIVELILKGKEQVSEANKKIDLKVKLTTTLPDNIYGSTPIRKTYFRTNRKFFKRWMNDDDPLSLAAHWFHEWLHVAGFRHIKINGDPDRKDAVYKIARFATSVGKKHVSRASLANGKEPGSGYLEFENRQTMDGFIEKTYLGPGPESNTIMIL